MITNANILRIDSPGVPDAGGNVAWSEGAAMECRCAFTPASARDKYAAAELAEEEDGTLLVKIFDLRFALNQASYALTAIQAEQKLLIQIDGASQVYYRVRDVETRAGFQASVKAFLRQD